MKYPHLFSEGKIGNVTIRNRTVMAPMISGLANFDGTPSEQLIRYYEERAKNGLGLLITEATRINNFYGAFMPRQLSLTHDRLIGPFGKMVDRVHAHGTKVFCQIHHPGRQAISILALMAPFLELMNRTNPFYNEMMEFGFEIMGKMMSRVDFNIDMVSALKLSRFPAVVAPSNVPSKHYFQRTRALRRFEIKRLEKQFIAAAKRVQLSGADGVQVHSSHGYLIQEFLSNLTNRRKDEYGGDLDNRMRFLVNIIKGIRRECGPDFPVTVRLTVDEFFRRYGMPHQGIELEEGVEIARRLDQLGMIDAFDVSTGTYDTFNYWLEPASFEPGWRKNLVEGVKKVVSVPIIAVNVIRTPGQAEQQLADGTQDFVSTGRQFLADPAWVAKAGRDAPEEISRCISCLRCIESLYQNSIRGGIMECSVNPKLGRERETAKPRVNGAGRTVVVIGGGPAGMKAADTAAIRGFKVVLFERSGAMGGQLKIAQVPPKKDKIDWCLEDLESADRRDGVEIRLNSSPSVADIKALDPYAVIVATGANPIVPNIPGVNGKNVYTINQVLEGAVKLKGKRVAVIGSGMTGLETAEKLAEDGNEIMIIEMLDKIGPDAFDQNLADVRSRLDKHKPEYITSFRLIEIGDGEITLEHTGSCRQIHEKADAVVLSVGVCSENVLFGKLKSELERVYAVGDARRIGRIYSAVREGFDTAWNL
ncbi:MAG: FAD-dependent oxidoreductase [Actinobacteria bacterium]|nr:FAD-dependent oxidoreductase [Actinomycetota bacterium]